MTLENCFINIIIRKIELHALDTCYSTGESRAHISTAYKSNLHYLYLPYLTVAAYDILVGRELSYTERTSRVQLLS